MPKNEYDANRAMRAKPAGLTAWLASNERRSGDERRSGGERRCASTDDVIREIRAYRRAMARRLVGLEP